jgi:outer membrane immunogenic protein
MIGPAAAADLLTTPSWIDSPAVQNGWNRFYMGVNGGYGWVRGQADATLGGVTVRRSDDVPGAIAGGQVGLNRQYQSVVLGVEADVRLRFADRR